MSMRGGGVDQVQFWIMQQAKRVEADCFGRRGQIASAQLMKQVVLAARVQVRSEVRHDPGIRRAVLEIKTLAERRLNTLLDAQLENLATSTSEDALKEAYGKLLAREWQCLRGDFPHVFLKAQNSIHGIRKNLERSTPQPSDPSPE
jgi:hypothetical protein